MTISNDAYDYLVHGNDLAEQTVDMNGMRRIQHFNESPYHRKTAIGRGGYGIKNEDGNAPPIGKTEKIDHRGGNSSTMATATAIDVALIGFSNQYHVLEGMDSEGRFRSVVVPEWIKNLPEGMRMRTGISLFAVLKTDPEQQLYELSFKGFVVTEAKQILTNLGKVCRTMSDLYTKERNKTIRVHTFAWWLSLGVGDSRMVGSGDAQSPVTPPALKTPLTREALEKSMVTKDEYLHFIDLRKQVDEYLATGRYTGQYDEFGRVALPAGMAIHALTDGGQRAEDPRNPPF